ncbi:unnamed protein product [Oppiella nova]|uniref:Uncharacterized protein n=1 Tax=Oppiella nova TaxID=334625 RepID=A0A7R9LJK1_9ACAR|nr:unnamed protein product [Oppiella nova]CAG2163625.1 unnamed protein product [Oppiella nova]
MGPLPSGPLPSDAGNCCTGAALDNRGRPRRCHTNTWNPISDEIRSIARDMTCSGAYGSNLPVPTNTQGLALDN